MGEDANGMSSAAASLSGAAAADEREPLLERVLRDAETFGGGHGFDDDVCLMAVDVSQFPVLAK